jgi:O-antigen/teichoic acid export membrane protein
VSLSTGRRNLKIQAAKNAVTSWLSLLANLVVGFFLAPFILHRLGDDAFGLWILVFSITGYYGLFDFGIRSSIIKYVAQFAARGETEELTRFVNTCLFVYSWIALFLVVVTVVCSRYVDAIFRVSPAFVVTARLLVLLVGAAIALGFPLGVFSGILEGLQKYTWENATQIASSLLRAVLIVIALQRGKGLLTIALITVIVPLFASACHILIVRRMLPLQFGRKFFDRTAFRLMTRYGSTTFISMVAGQLRYKTDAAVIGIFLSSSAITFFSIGSKLVDYSRGVVDALASVFAPMSSHLDAQGDMDGLRRIFIFGNRACAMIAFPICAGAIVLGKSLIYVWVGPKYVASFVILVLLILPQTLDLAQATSPRILYGMNRHQVLSWARVIEGFANLVLSILLVRHYGVVGVALGTALPFLCMNVLFLPAHVCRILDVPLFDYIRQAYLAPLLLCAPMTAALVLLQHLFRADTYPRLLLQVVIGGAIYGVGAVWFVATRDPMGERLRTRIAIYMRETFDRSG